MQGKVGAVLAPLGFGLLAIALLGAAGANAVTDAAPPSLTLPAGATTNACNQLNAFANQAKAQHKKAVADGTNLLTRQNEVEAALDCVKSTAPPVLLGPRADVTTTTAPGKPTATVLFTGASSSVSCAPTSPAALAVGANTVQCSATNANGTTRTSFVVTVVDHE